MRFLRSMAEQRLTVITGRPQKVTATLKQMHTGSMATMEALPQMTIPKPVQKTPISSALCTSSKDYQSYLKTARAIRSRQFFLFTFCFTPTGGQLRRNSLRFAPFGPPTVSCVLAAARTCIRQAPPTSRGRGVATSAAARRLSGASLSLTFFCGVLKSFVMGLPR